MPTSSSLRRFAEDPSACGEIRPGSGLTRVLTDRYCLLLGPVPTFTSVSRLRLAPEDVAETLAEVRDLVATQGHREAMWWVGSSATPADLVDRLVAHGLVPDRRPGSEPHATALVLADEPPPGPPDITVRRVASLEEFVAVNRVAAEAFGEPPDRVTEVGDDVRRVDDGRACVLHGASFATVSGIDVDADELPRLVADVRALVPPGSRPLWLLGPSTRPPDAAERLRALGLRTPRDRLGVVHALVLTASPPRVDGAEVRVVETFDDFVASLEVQWEVFGTPPERRGRREELEPVFRAWQAGGHLVSVLGLLDGRPAASGRLVRSPRGGFLIGGCVAPWARGRGLYRALVRARFEQAAAWDAPALVTHAAPDTSLPILLRLGFEELCVLERLEDAV